MIGRTELLLRGGLRGRGSHEAAYYYSAVVPYLAHPQRLAAPHCHAVDNLCVDTGREPLLLASAIHLLLASVLAPAAYVDAWAGNRVCL